MMKYSRYLTIDIFWYFLLGGVIIAIDQTSKNWAFSVGHAYYSNICIELVPVINRGLAFSLLSSNRIYVHAILIAVIAFFIIFLMCYAYWKRSHDKFIFAETLVLSASISNLVDRFLYGGVLDFITVNIVSSLTLPVGNIADICIVGGLIYMCYELIMTWDENIHDD